MLTIELLGGFRLQENGVTVHLEMARSHELLAYLALHGAQPSAQPVARAELAQMLWPESNETQARTNLRNLLFKLGKAWPSLSTYLDIRRQTIGWQAGKQPDCDVTRLQAAFTAQGLSGAQDTDAPQDPVFTSAEADVSAELALYRGELLPGHYAEWILVARARLHRQYLQALAAWVGWLEGQRRYAEALTQAERLLEQDPLREASYRVLMRLHSILGDRATALRIYHTCASRLESELNVPPSAATQTLYASLLEFAGEDAAGPARPLAVTRLTQTLPLVGRSAEWRQLRTAWQAACAGVPRLVLIRGEAGMGKTRLALELVDVALHAGHLTAQSRAYAAEGAFAFAPIAEWLRQPALRKTVSALDSIWQVEVARLLPELLEENPQLPAPGPLYENWQRQRFFEGLARLLLTHSTPVLLHMDDLQWCDEETLSFLHYLLHAVRLRPTQLAQAGLNPGATGQLLLVGTARSEDLAQNGALARLLHHLRQDDLLWEVDLSPLSFEETAALGQALLVRDAPLPAVTQTYLWHGSEGNPLFLVETVRAYGNEAALLDAADAASAANGATESVTSAPDVAGLSSSIRASNFPAPKIRAIIDARLDQLSPEARELAQLAAVVGRAFSFTILRATGVMDATRLVAALDELWQRRIVREREAGDYDFNHDRIREIAYAEISPARRSYYHRQIAQALLAQGAGETDALSGQLAFHHEAGGEVQPALDCYLRAGEHALAAYAGERALHYFHKAAALAQRSVGLPASGAEAAEAASTQNALRAQALGGCGRAYFMLDQMAQAIASFQEALRHCPVDAPLRPRLLYWLADAHFADYVADATEPIVRDALAVAEAQEDIETQCQALSLLGQIHSQRGELKTERRLIERALQLARQSGNRWREGRTLADLGFLQAQRGFFVAAATAAQDALRLLQATDDVAGQAFAWNMLGRAEGGRGQYGAAFAAFAESERLAHSIDLRSMGAQIPNMRGWLYQQLGDYTRAQAENQRGLALAQEWQKTPAEISAQLNLCLDAIFAQDYAGALDQATHIEKRLEQGDFGFHNWRWRLRLLHIKGLALLQAGELAAARTAVEAGLELAYATEATKYVTLHNELRGRIELAQGDSASAIAHLEKVLVSADSMHYQPLRWQARLRLAMLHGETQLGATHAQMAQSIVADIASELEQNLGDADLAACFLAAVAQFEASVKCETPKEVG